MSIKVQLTHKSHYHFDRLVKLSPHEIRLRPAAHARTPVEAYSLNVLPAKHFINWQQDPYGNWLARIVFPEQANELKVEVSLVADMTVINPFDFFVEEYAEQFPFQYTVNNQKELAPYLELEQAPELGAKFHDWLARARKDLLDNKDNPLSSVNLLVALNGRLQQDISYLIRLEPGIQTPEQTLTKASGSCRDSAWLLVQILRSLGIAARFASGYLIQLVADQKSLDGPSGTDRDFCDLHAWCEAYIPGAGWIGLDPTSGLLTGEGHIPLACAAVPTSAAAIFGFTDRCESTLDYQMSVVRLHEDPRVTKPLSDGAWQAVNALGERVDRDLKQRDVRLTMGGEPTFVSIDDMDGAEWNFTALAPKKFELAIALFSRMREHFAKGGVPHFGQGKWYPGEPLPRWALSCLWRTDGVPLWRDQSLIAHSKGNATPDAMPLMNAISDALLIDPRYINALYEDVWQALNDETKRPINIDPLEHDLKDANARSRLAKLLNAGLDEPVAYVLPLASLREDSGPAIAFRSCRWPMRQGHIALVPGDSPAGYRLPLGSIPWVAAEEFEPLFEDDPWAKKLDLADAKLAKANAIARAEAKAKAKADEKKAKDKTDKDSLADDDIAVGKSAKNIIKTALVVQVRDGIAHVFLPPVESADVFTVLIGAIEAAAKATQTPVRLEGYLPSGDSRLKQFAVTPDPGVIEVNIHPAHSWAELASNTQALYAMARESRLGTEKFMLDGRHMGTGGGNHVTIGGVTPADSPLLRRPDLLRSLITFWQNHPSLSYLFSGQFIGPTSQSPRVDEARSDTLYELELAFEQLDEAFKDCDPANENDKPWLVDRILRNFLVDLTGNTHRAEFSIDKLFAPGSATGRLGLLEFRAFEMPPHAHMSLLQLLLVRALIAHFWVMPYKAPLIRWGSALHDQFMLQHFVMQDFQQVLAELKRSKYDFALEWFLPFFEFRFPRYGVAAYGGMQLELRQAIEPWHVLGEEVSQSGTSRYVDSSLERMQLKITGLFGAKYAVTCNGRSLPLRATDVPGEYVAGIRYKAWAPPSALHPTIKVHTPLRIDIVDLNNGRSIGGCTYHVAHPGGRNYDTFPVNALEAQARRVARFAAHGHTPGPIEIVFEAVNPAFPSTLDLRKKVVAAEQPMADQVRQHGQVQQ